MAGIVYPPNFLAAFDFYLQDEGGYVNDPADPGRETQFGISRREYPNLDIKNLTRDDAAAIIFRDYWLKFHLNSLPSIGSPSIATKTLNLAALMGPGSAILCLQRALVACGCSVALDGVVGPQTMDAAARVETAAQLGIGRSAPGLVFVSPLLSALRSEAGGYLRLEAVMNAHLDRFQHGWANRAYRLVFGRAAQVQVDRINFKRAYR